MLFFFQTHYILIRNLVYIFKLSFIFSSVLYAAQREVIGTEKINLPLYKAPRYLKQEEGAVPVVPKLPDFESLCLGGKLYSHGICSRGVNVLAGSTSIIGSLFLNLKELDLKGHLIVHGNVCAKSFLTLSDKRLKKDIVSLDSEQCLENVLNLIPKEFRFTKEAQSNCGCSQESQRGFIAQEVKSIIPQAVCIDKDSVQKIHMLDYNKLIPDLVGALQECYKKIDDLQMRIKKLEKKT